MPSSGAVPLQLCIPGCVQKAISPCVKLARPFRIDASRCKTGCLANGKRVRTVVNVSKRHM